MGKYQIEITAANSKKFFTRKSFFKWSKSSCQAKKIKIMSPGKKNPIGPFVKTATPDAANEIK